jgi:hypothetical protein
MVIGRLNDRRKSENCVQEHLLISAFEADAFMTVCSSSNSQIIVSFVSP